LVGGLIALNKAGEERLLEVAINGTIPLGVAMDIANRLLKNGKNFEHIFDSSV